MRYEDFTGDTILTLLLKPGIDASQKKVTEIMIPTCSYRMGVRSIGFGMAVLGKYQFSCKGQFFWWFLYLVFFFL